MNSIITRASCADDIDRLVDELTDQLPEQPSLAIQFFNANINAEKLQSAFTKKIACPVLSASSCMGGMLQKQAGMPTQVSAGVFYVFDSNGDYGVGSSSILDSPELAAQQALTQALQQSDREYESPDVIWLSTPPGQEEKVIKGLTSVVGPNVPIIGGSCADNDISGDWKQFDQNGVYQNAVMVSVFFTSFDVGYSFSSGYSPSQHSATVTRAEGRTIYELDDEPAAQVYNRWCNQGIQEFINGGNILGASTLNPLGRVISHVNIDQYLLSHPESVTPDGGLTLFSEVVEGDVLVLMEGSIQSLVNRAAEVYNTSAKLLPEDSTPCGFLMVYCAGCMLAVSDRIEQVRDSVTQASSAIPSLATFTFGEQGFFLDGHVRHGNLMISCLVFGGRDGHA